MPGMFVGAALVCLGTMTERGSVWYSQFAVVAPEDAASVG